MQKRFGFFLSVAAMLATGTFVFAADVVPAGTSHSPALALKQPSYTYTRIFYFRDNARARASLFTHPDSIDVLAPQTYAFDGAGNLKGKVRSNILLFAKKHNIKVMPLVTNGRFSKSSYQGLLDNAAAQDAAVARLVAEARQYGYWGWQFDFEQMDVSYRDKYSAFVKKTADTMRQNNFVLSVAVIAQVSENPADYPNDLWQKTIGAYDYAALGAASDFVSVMSYDDPDSIGPVVQYAWLKRVIAYSVRQIPAQKLSLGIPFYYWRWNNTTGARVGIGGRAGIDAVFQKHKVTAHYSEEHEAPYLTYWKRGTQFTIWYENARSVAKKIVLMKDYGLHGFSAWALGLELASVYNALK